jgi:hypothetical protein
VKSIGLLVQARREELVTYWDWVDNVMKRCTKDKLAALPAALTPQQAYILARSPLLLVDLGQMQASPNQSIPHLLMTGLEHHLHGPL